MSLLEALGVLFITLKLLGYITWSWWLVLSPILVSAAITFIGVFTVLLRK